MLPNVRRLTPWAVAVVSVLASTACATPEEEDGGDTQDEISAKEAAREFTGSGEVGKFQPGSAARDLGVASWAAYGVKSDLFAGAVLFAVDADGDVKHAILSGQRTGDTRTSIALINYNKAGRTGASSADKATLEALAADVNTIKETLAKRARETDDCKTALMVAAAGLAVVAAGWWLAVPASVAVGAGWVSSVVFGTGVAVTVGGGWTVWAGAAAANVSNGVSSCGAVLRR